jgi:hypothetical protein
MYKSTIQQIILFIITTFIIFQAGKYVINLNDIKTFTDFGVVMIFFIAFVFFINYFARLTSKLVRTLSF